MLVLFAGLAVSAWNKNLLTSLYQNVYMGEIQYFGTPITYYDYALVVGNTASSTMNSMQCVKSRCGNNVCPGFQSSCYKDRVNQWPTHNRVGLKFSYVVEGETTYYPEICEGDSTQDDGPRTLVAWKDDYNTGACTGFTSNYAVYFCACPIATIDSIYSINGEVGRSHLTAGVPMTLDFINVYDEDPDDPTDTGLFDNQAIWIKFVSASLTGTCNNSPAIPGSECNLTKTSPGRSGCEITGLPSGLRDGTQVHVCYKAYHITGSSNGTVEGETRAWSSWRPMGGKRGSKSLGETPPYGVFEDGLATDRTVPYLRERTHLLLTPRFDKSPSQPPDASALQYSLLYDWVSTSISGHDRKTMTWSIINGTVSTSILRNRYALASNPLTLSGIPNGRDYIYFDDYSESYWNAFYSDCKVIDPSLNASGCSPNVTYASTNGDVRYDWMNDDCQTQPWSPSYDINITNMNNMINGTELGYRGERIEFQVYVDCEPDAPNCFTDGGGTGVEGSLTVEFWSSYPRGVLSYEVFPLNDLTCVSSTCKCFYPDPEKYVGCAIDLVQFVPDIWWNREGVSDSTACYGDQTIFGQVVQNMLTSYEMTWTRSEIFEKLSWIFSFDDASQRLYAVKRTVNGSRTSQFLTYQLSEEVSDTHIWDGGAWVEVNDVRIPTFKRDPVQSLNVTCNGTWEIDVHDGMIVLARDDDLVTYMVGENATNRSNLVYTHAEVFNITGCTPDSRFDQVRPKPWELSGYYHANIEYFNEPLGRVGLMDIPNLRDGYVSMLTYLRPDAFFTDARVNETCTQACMNFEHDERAMVARNGTGLCVTHEVQSLASTALYGHDCRTPLNRTVSGGWTYSNLTRQVYDKFYVHHGMFLYGMYDNMCHLGWLNVTDCVDMYFTFTYAAVLTNISEGFHVDIYGWNETDNTYSMTMRGYNFTETADARFVVAVGTFKHTSVYVVNGTQIDGQYQTSSKTWKWTIGGSPGYRDSPRGSNAQFADITSVYGHGHRIYVVDNRTVRLVETMGTKVTTLLNETNTDDTKIYVDDHYVYLWNQDNISIYTEQTILPIFALESSRMSTVNISYAGALSIGDEYLYVFNTTNTSDPTGALFISDFRLYNLTACFNDSLAWDEEAELAAICVCDSVDNRTVCPDPDLNSSFRWRAQPQDLPMGEMYSRKEQTDRIGVYNDCSGVCATVGGQCIETLQLSASDFRLFEFVDGLQCEYVDSAARMEAFGLDTSNLVCFGVRNDAQCTMKQHGPHSEDGDVYFCCCGGEDSYDCAGYPPGDANRTQFIEIHHTECSGVVNLSSVEHNEETACPLVHIRPDIPLDILRMCECERACDKDPLCSGFNLYEDDDAMLCHFVALELTLEQMENTTCVCDLSMDGCEQPAWAAPTPSPTPFPVPYPLNPAQVEAMDRAMMFDPTPAPSLHPTTAVPTRGPFTSAPTLAPTLPPTIPELARISWGIFAVILGVCGLCACCIGCIGYCVWEFRRGKNPCVGICRCIICMLRMVCCFLPGIICCCLCLKILPKWCRTPPRLSGATPKPRRPRGAANTEPLLKKRARAARAEVRPSRAANNAAKQAALVSSEMGKKMHQTLLKQAAEMKRKREEASVKKEGTMRKRTSKRLRFGFGN